MKHPLKKQANDRQVGTPGLQPGCLKVHKRLRACLKIQMDAVFVPKPVWRGEARENTPRGSATEEQPRQTVWVMVSIFPNSFRSRILPPLAPFHFAFRVILSHHAQGHILDGMLQGPVPKAHDADGSGVISFFYGRPPKWRARGWSGFGCLGLKFFQEWDPLRGE